MSCTGLSSSLNSKITPPLYNTGATLPQLQSSAVSACSSGDSKACAENVARLAFQAKAASMGKLDPPMANPISLSFSLGVGPFSYAPIDAQTYTSFARQSAPTRTDFCGNSAICSTCSGPGVATLNERL